jgi:hypothetical protein
MSPGKQAALCWFLDGFFINPADEGHISLHGAISQNIQVFLIVQVYYVPNLSSSS